MHSPETARSRLRPWRDIAAYYDAALERPAFKNWTKLRDFVRGVRSKPYSDTLATVGTLGSVLVFRDPECVADRGYFLITSSPSDTSGSIRLGFFPSKQHGPAALSLFGDAESAVNAFERALVEHGFITAPAASAPQ